MKCIFRYLKSTIGIGIVYHGDTFGALISYSNYDHAAILDARRSVTEYGFTIRNSLGSWKATILCSHWLLKL